MTPCRRIRPPRDTAEAHPRSPLIARLTAGFRVFLMVAALSPALESAQAWTRVSGEVIEGKPAVFLQEDKTVWFARSMTQGDGEFVAAEDLSLRDRQRLLISPVYYDSFPETPAWPPKKRRLVLLWIFSPVIALYLGFWIAGLVVTGKFNPAKAFFGFAGGWLLGTVMFGFYLFFSGRIGGGGFTVLFGGGVALVLISMYISAVYQCDLFRGLLIFLLQLFVSGGLIALLLFGSEAAFDRHEVERFWNERIFAPVGMIDDPDPFQSLKRDSSDA